MKKIFVSITVLLLVLSMLFGCAVQTTIESESTDSISDTKVASTPVSKTVEETTEIDKSTIFTKNGVSLRVEELIGQIVIGETTYAEVCTIMKKEGIPRSGAMACDWYFGVEGRIGVWFRKIYDEYNRLVDSVANEIQIMPADSSNMDTGFTDKETVPPIIDPNIVYSENGISVRVETLAKQIRVGQSLEEVYNFFGNRGDIFYGSGMTRKWDFGQEGKIMIWFKQKIGEDGKVYGDYLVFEVKTFPQYAWS